MFSRSGRPQRPRFRVREEQAARDGAQRAAEGLPSPQHGREGVERLRLSHGAGTGQSSERPSLRKSVFTSVTVLSGETPTWTQQASFKTGSQITFGKTETALLAREGCEGLHTGGQGTRIRLVLHKGRMSYGNGKCLGIQESLDCVKSKWWCIQEFSPDKTTVGARPGGRCLWTLLEAFRHETIESIFNTWKNRILFEGITYKMLYYKPQINN